MKFALGRCVATPGALQALSKAGIDPAGLLTRHVGGDWGQVCKEDAKANEDALKYGTRLFSVYMLKGTRYYVITEADRSSTTILLPHEY